jgi:pimeloyl-ACP methyl ester carboxylesterase
MLNYTSFGEISDKPSILLVHGLFGSARNWRAIARNLATERRVHVVDMRNHGDSFWDDSQSYHDMANDLAVVIEHIGEHIDVLGHSMGGKAGMILALTRPELLNRLLVIDIAPKTYEHDQVSNIEIMKSLDLDAFTRRSEADVLLAHSVSDPMLRAFFLQSVIIAQEGNRWQLNLNALSENMDHIIGFPQCSGSFPRPCLFLRGGQSEYVNDTDMDEIYDLFPLATLRTIEGAGHWVQAEATRAFLSEIKDFLA